MLHALVHVLLKQDSEILKQIQASKIPTYGVVERIGGVVSPGPVMSAVIDELFDNVSVKFNERNGGYSRIVLLGTRQGDNAEVAILELVE